MKRKPLLALGLTGALLVGGASMAFAGTTNENYNLTVGKYNGSAYTAQQTKSTSSASGVVNSGTVGGNYTVDVRMEATSGTGSWVQKVNDNETRNLPNSVGSGLKAKAAFSNDATTPVNVQISGNWRSN